MAGVDAVMMRRNPISVRPQPRAAVPVVRPSPFQHVAPEIEVTQTLPVHAVAARTPAPGTDPVRPTSAAPQPESRFGRFLSRIPLLRHFRTHPAADVSESR